MSIKFENQLSNKIVAKGIFKGMSVDGFLFEDEKDETVDTLNFADFKKFEGKIISVTIANVDKNPSLVNDSNEETE